MSGENHDSLYGTAVSIAVAYSQGLEVGWAQKVWGTEVPQWGPGAEPRWDLKVKPPEARYAYTICSGQTHFRDVFIEDIRCTFMLMWSLLPHP